MTSILTLDPRGTAVTRENLATNPSFETASGTVTVRTNLLRNPVLGTAATDWGVGSLAGGAGAAGRVDLGGSWWYRVTFTTAPTGFGAAIINWNTGTGVVTPGLTYTARIFGRVSWAGAQMVLKIIWHDAAGAYLSEGPSGAIATPAAGEGAVYIVEGAVAPAGAGLAELVLYQVAGTLPPVNATMEATEAFVENAATFGGYFDGVTAAAGGFTYAWSGTAHASTSVQQAPGVAGLTGASNYQSKEWFISGTKSVYVPAGKTGTVALGAASTAVVVARNSGQTLTVGTATDTSTTADDVLRAYGATTVTLGPGYWDKLIIVKGVYAGDYFDGSTPSSGDFTYDWVDAANASPSTETLTPDPDTTTTAIFALGYEVTRAVRSIVHEVPNATTSPVTFKPAGPRSGTIEYLFETRDECRRAEVIHTRVGYVTLTDADWPDSPMRYVPQDEVTTTLDPETRVRWILSTGFVEVPQ